MNKIDLCPTEEIKNSSRYGLYKQKKDLIFSFISPILFALLMGLKSEVVNSFKGHSKILLRELARCYREGDGDFGISFEYSIHSAIRNQNPLITEQIHKALNLCGIQGNNITSILLGFEKSRILQINDELINTLTDKSILVTDTIGTQIKIIDYIEDINNSFRNIKVRKGLPKYLGGIWKADLLIGDIETDMWAAASVKINPISLEYANGIAIGIVPINWRKPNYSKNKKNMVICRLLYDNGFMQYFYSACRTVFAFFKADSYVPNERFLSCIEELEIAKYLEDNRNVPVLELVDEIFVKLTHKKILLPEKKTILTTDVFNNISTESSNRAIIVPNIILPELNS